jgi:pimeloyl-ACP methyl ester carboxylesterase
MTKLNKLLILLLMLFFYSCGENPLENDPIETIERGEIVEIISENELSLEELQTIFDGFAGSGGVEINLRNGVKIYSVIYRTIDYQGNSTDASGVFVVPQASGSYPLMSLHHGTQSKRDNVGSQNILSSADALLAGALGYVAISADMLGLGISEIVHPYHVADVNATTVIDFIRAVKKYSSENNIDLNGQLFLAGYSQGGYTTMAVHKKMQEELFDEFSVTASVPMAGAHDLMGTARHVVENDNYDKPSFLAFITYAEVYGWNDLSLFFREPYNNLIPTLFNGTLTTDDIDETLPNKLSELFTSSLIDSIKNGDGGVVVEKLKENSLLDWAPQAPVLIIHGNADTFVPYQNALSAKENWEANGALSVELITIEGGTHYTSILPAVFYAMSWFENFRTDVRLASNF